MRVLWITFNYFPDICKAANLNEGVTGSWVFAYAKNLMKFNPKIELGVASPYKGKDLRIFDINGIKYYLIPSLNNSVYNPKLEPLWLKVKEDFGPEIIHIHGSEKPFGLSYVRACGPIGVVLSMQGLVSVIERHYFGGISRFQILRNISLRDIIRLDTLFSQKRNMKRRGAYEVELIQKIDHVFGRTDWDRAHAWSINAKINYYLCDEPLRDSFYNTKWKYNDCERYSIFISQGQYPLKGLHKLIEALPLILREFPKTKVYVSGTDILNNRGVKISGYGLYISRLLKKFSMTESVFFIGQLSEDQIIQKLLKSNVFVCASSIENGSISLSEAQIIGVPSVAAAVGGINSRITDGKDGLLYRFDEPELLAWQICKVFSDYELLNSISSNGIVSAKNRQDPKNIVEVLNASYQKIFSNNIDLNLL
jgi:glycosyltransferase involved in cell wall biosynthesis